MDTHTIPEEKSSRVFPHILCLSVCAYTNARPSDGHFSPTTSFASSSPPFPFPFYITFFLLPLSVCRGFRVAFFLFYSYVLFQTVTIHLFCTCDIQCHTSPHHPSIYTHIHIYLPIHTCSACQSQIDFACSIVSYLNMSLRHSKGEQLFTSFNLW